MADFLDGKVVLHHGCSRDVLQGIAAASIDAVVTDPPYALGFMGKAWDTGAIAFDAEFWAEVLRVLKPGGHVLAMGGTRTYHRLVCAIEDSGFEIRDSVAWLYGSGFPKSHNLGGGWGTALKPAMELICLARKPLIGTVAANVLAHGVGALNVDGCRVGTSKRVPGSLSTTPNRIYGAGLGGASQDGTEGGHNPNLGRWPANVVHDGSDEVLAAFGVAGESTSREGGVTSRTGDGLAFQMGTAARTGHDDSGTPARFFYSAKADADGRAGSSHPTVKPVDLMQWLCRLVTPPGGTILDPFAGSGTTGEAAIHEGFKAILIEREADYVHDIARRLELIQHGREVRALKIAKAKEERRQTPWQDGTLFACE